MQPKKITKIKNASPFSIEICKKRMFYEYLLNSGTIEEGIKKASEFQEKIEEGIKKASEFQEKERIKANAMQ
jgi:biotin synthase-related radical SAM superfamily protein